MNDELDELLNNYFSYAAGEHLPTSKHTPLSLKQAIQRLIIQARASELSDLQQWGIDTEATASEYEAQILNRLAELQKELDND